MKNLRIALRISEEFMKKNKQLNIKECEECGEEFKSKRQWQKFCSPQCRFDNWNKKNPRIKTAQKMQE